jgi:hypothetical protein
VRLGLTNDHGTSIEKFLNDRRVLRGCKVGRRIRTAACRETLNVAKILYRYWDTMKYA